MARVYSNRFEGEVSAMSAKEQKQSIIVLSPSVFLYQKVQITSPSGQECELLGPHADQLQLPEGCKVPDFSGMCLPEILQIIVSGQIHREMVASAWTELKNSFLGISHPGKQRR